VIVKTFGSMVKKPNRLLVLLFDTNCTISIEVLWFYSDLDTIWIHIRYSRC